MAAVSSGIRWNANFTHLKPIALSAVQSDVASLLVNDETMVCAFQTIRFQVIFTSKRIFVVKEKGILRKKVSYFSYPYSKIQYYGVQTAGILDFDSELLITFSNGTNFQFDFCTNVNIKEISHLISEYVL